MKILKYIGIGLVALLLLVVVLAFVMPTEHSINVDRKINSKKIVVFNAINDLRSHEVWNPWKQEDENMSFVLGDKIVGKGASYSWTSETMGNGTYYITESDSDNGISTKAVFQERGEGTGIMKLTSDGNSTDVNWQFNWTTGRFANVFAPLMKMGFRKTLKRGLKNLETLVDERTKNSIYYGYSVEESITPLSYYAVKRGEISQEKRQQFYSSNLGSLFSKVQAAGATMKGKPCALIYNYKPNEGKIDMAAAIPLSDNINIPGAFQEIIEGGKGITVDYYGDVAEIGKAHDAIQNYMADRELLHNWPVIEEYITDPSEEQDPSQWLTKITYPVGN